MLVESLTMGVYEFLFALVMYLSVLRSRSVCMGVFVGVIFIMGVYHLLLNKIYGNENILTFNVPVYSHTLLYKLTITMDLVN